ncbi:MAG: hypothetical protein ACRDRS_16915 [Pseudonocardiaceae bacterium]
MPIPRMDAHKRVGVLRCDGCWSAVTAELPATPSALGEAERLVERVVLAWSISAEHAGAVREVTHVLVRQALARESAAMVAFALVRHVDGVIVEVCEAVTWSPGAVLLLNLPQPSGLHWCHDAQGQLCGRLLWCGVPTPQRISSAGAARGVLGGYRPPIG